MAEICSFDAPQRALTFAQEQIFSDGETIDAPPTKAPIGLEAVIARLQLSGAMAGLQTFACCGLTAWIASARNGARTKGNLASSGIGWRHQGSVARWLADKGHITLPSSAQLSKGRNLESLIKQLHDSEINAGFELLPHVGLRAWIGDPLNGIMRSAAVSPVHATTYLHQLACRLFPESTYRKQLSERTRHT
jgi:hypothetical protein